MIIYMNCILLLFDSVFMNTDFLKSFSQLGINHFTSSFKFTFLSIKSPDFIIFIFQHPIIFFFEIIELLIPLSLLILEHLDELLHLDLVLFTFDLFQQLSHTIELIIKILEILSLVDIPSNRNTSISNDTSRSLLQYLLILFLYFFDFRFQIIKSIITSTCHHDLFVLLITTRLHCCTLSLFDALLLSRLSRTIHHFHWFRYIFNSFDRIHRFLQQLISISQILLRIMVHIVHYWHFMMMVAF